MRLHLSNELFIRDNNDRIFLWLKVTFNWTVNGGKKKKVSFFLSVCFSRKKSILMSRRARERERLMHDGNKSSHNILIAFVLMLIEKSGEFSFQIIEIEQERSSFSLVSTPVYRMSSSN